MAGASGVGPELGDTPDVTSGAVTSHRSLDMRAGFNHRTICGRASTQAAVPPRAKQLVVLYSPAFVALIYESRFCDPGITGASPTPQIDWDARWEAICAGFV